MFREMRRKNQQLSEQAAIDILKTCSSGVLALLGDDDYPYALPISYVYCDSKLYFHGAKIGHKTDAINKHEKASFCVIEQDAVVPEKYTTYFRSAIAFGKIHVLTDESEIRKAVIALSAKYHPTDTVQNRDNFINTERNALCMMELSIEHLTGKEAIELVKSKKMF